MELHRMMLLGTSVLLLGMACTPDLQPIGEPNVTVQRLEADGWMSTDTIFDIDPQTYAESYRLIDVDLRPDTLNNGTVVYQLTEYLPVYGGCETADDPAICTQTQLNALVRDQLEYPTRALAEGREGVTVATFVIGPDGKIQETGVERSLGDDLDGAVLKLIRKMPIWHPGFHGGKPVAVRYKFPVTFRLPRD